MKKETISKLTFLSWDEFALCCAAAGIEDLPCYSFGGKDAMSEKETLEAVFRLTDRSLLRSRGEGYVLDSAFGEAFRVMRSAWSILAVYLPEREEPSALLYHSGGRFTYLRPEGTEAVALECGGGDQLGIWLEDAGADMPEEPAEAPEETDEDGAGQPVLRLECLDQKGSETAARLWVLRGGLYDRLKLETARGAGQYPYSAGHLRAAVKNLLREATHGTG